MGRVRLRIRRLKCLQDRKITYSKRCPGLIKKAKELSILCDIDIALVMISPFGKSSSFHGERSNLEQVITKYAELSRVERRKRKLDTLESLKKQLEKIDHNVNIDEFMGPSSPSPEILACQMDLLQLQAKVAAAKDSLRTLDQINNVEQLQEIQNSLSESLDQILLLKSNLTYQAFLHNSQ